MWNVWKERVYPESKTIEDSMDKVSTTKSKGKKMPKAIPKTKDDKGQ